MLGRRCVRLFSESVNYYKLFNVPVNFTEQQLKASYLELVKQFHPDLSKEPNAAEMFRVIQEGYNTLSNPMARIKYQVASLGEAQDKRDQNEILESMREKYLRGYSRKDPINDEYNFSYKLFRDHYETMEQPKADYKKFEGQNESYYARKDEKGENPWRQATAASAAVLIVAAAFYYTNA